MQPLRLVLQAVQLLLEVGHQADALLGEGERRRLNFRGGVLAKEAQQKVAVNANRPLGADEEGDPLEEPGDVGLLRREDVVHADVVDGQEVHLGEDVICG